MSLVVVVESKKYKILRDFKVQDERVIKARRPGSEVID